VCSYVSGGGYIIYSIGYSSVCSIGYPDPIGGLPLDSGMIAMDWIGSSSNIISSSYCQSSQFFYSSVSFFSSSSYQLAQLGLLPLSEDIYS